MRAVRILVYDLFVVGSIIDHTLHLQAMASSRIVPAIEKHEATPKYVTQ